MNKFFTIITNIVSVIFGVLQILYRPVLIMLLWNYIVTYGTDWPKVTFLQCLVIFEIIFRILITYIPYKMMQMVTFPPTEYLNDKDVDENNETDITDNKE